MDDFAVSLSRMTQHKSEHPGSTGLSLSGDNWRGGAEVDLQLLTRVGFVMAGQSETLVPADRKLYALRDASGTVPSIPLIASSIMSKKLAEDLDGLVLDVKVGEGAFMPDMDRARQLAETMIGIGRSHDLAVTALITDMNQPRTQGGQRQRDRRVDRRPDRRRPEDRGDHRRL